MTDTLAIDDTWQQKRIFTNFDFFYDVENKTDDVKYNQKYH